MENSRGIIATALMNYINDSAGEGSEEAKEITEAWASLNKSIDEVVENMEIEEEKHYELTMFENHGEEVDAENTPIEELSGDHIYYHIRVLKGE